MRKLASLRLVGLHYLDDQIANRPPLTVEDLSSWPGCSRSRSMTPARTYSPRRSSTSTPGALPENLPDLVSARPNNCRRGPLNASG
jgi:hypothetical protein